MACRINDYRSLNEGAVEAQAFGECAECRIIGSKIRCEVVEGTTWGKNKNGNKDEINVGPNETGICEASENGVRCWEVRGSRLMS